MKSLKDAFNNAQFRDHAEGAILGMATGFAIPGAHVAGLAIIGFAGLVLGRKTLTEMFSMAVQGREMAAMAPALAAAPKLSR